MWNPPIALIPEEQKMAARTRKTRKFFVFLIGVWRILCIAQIEHKRRSVDARSAHPQRPPERISPCSSSWYSIRPHAWPVCVGCTCLCPRHHGSLGSASPLPWWSPQPGTPPSPVWLAALSRLPPPRMGRTRCAAGRGRRRPGGLPCVTVSWPTWWPTPTRVTSGPSRCAWMTQEATKTRAPAISQPSPTTRSPPRAKAKRHPTPPRAPCMGRAAAPWAHGPMRMMGGSPSARRPGGVSSERGPLSRGATCASKPRWPQRGWRRSSRAGRLVSRSTCSLTVGRRPSACAHAAAVRAGRGWVRSRPIGSWTPRSAPNGPKRFDTSGIRACSGPRQTGDRVLPWCAPSRGDATRCRLPSVSSAANGPLGTNPRSIVWARTCRGRPSQS